MATKKKVVATEPVVIRGSHSIRTEYPDGRVEFETIWEELVNDVNAALNQYAKTKTEEKPAKKVKKGVKEAVKEVVEKIAKPNTKSTAKKATSKPKKAK